jgi:hypothetical protein
MKTAYIVLFTSCLVLYFSSCNWDQAEHVDCPPDVNCTNLGQNTMHFTQDIVPILTTYCTAEDLGDCHSANSSLGFDYTTYGGLLPYLPDVFNSFVLDPSTATMPKSISNGPTQLSCCDKEKLSLWIAQGFPDN